MSIFEYYFELLDKPRYLLTEGEDTFLSFFPFAIIFVVIIVALIIVTIVAAIIDKIKNK